MASIKYLILLLAMLPLSLKAQTYGSPDGQPYPQNYFRNPLKIPIFLAGNFGECRPGHFHSGVDIKTLGKENQPVHAAADGYISRIKMEKGGFGHALYVTHPNGYTTLYAHLNKFVPKIQAYLRRQQYQKERWDVDLALSPTDFPVKQGEQIAWSGNTGASTAPHLHFEIRNTKTEHPLNPELFGLPIIDKIPPLPTEIVLYQPEFSFFYSFPRVSISLEKKDRFFTPAKLAVRNDCEYLAGDTIFIHPWMTGIGVNVNDYMDGSDNTLAFYTAKVYMNDTLQEQITLDDIGYDESRYVNAYADYRIRQEEHKWVQCLFRLPGDRLHVFSNASGHDGYLQVPVISAGSSKITIVIADDKGNESTIRLYLQAIPGCDQNSEVTAGNGDIHFAQGKVNDFKNDHISFSLDERQLYDNIQFQWTAAARALGFSDEEHVGSPDVPVHHYFDISVRANKPVPAALQSKIALIYTDGRDTDGRAAAQADGGWYHAKVRNFGTYWLEADTTAPVIQCLEKDGANLGRSERISFVVKDAQTSVSAFSGYLDGKWICFESHNEDYFYDFDEHCPKGKHRLAFQATDENGNTATYTLSFTR